MRPAHRCANPECRAWRKLARKLLAMLAPILRDAVRAEIKAKRAKGSSRGRLR